MDYVIQLFEPRADLNSIPDDIDGEIIAVNDGDGFTAANLIKIENTILRETDEGKTVLVVCAAGRSRSAIAVVSYLMLLGYTYKSAWKLVSYSHHDADPNLYMLYTLMNRHNLAPVLSSLEE